MDKYTSFADRIFSPTPEILGLKLLPFTLGHSILLKSANSKFVVGGLKDCTLQETITELVFAILVCSVSYQEFKDEVQSGTLPLFLKQYAEDLLKQVKKVKEFNIFDKVNSFVLYLQRGTSTALFYNKESNDDVSKPNPIELEESIIATLMSECNFTRDECLNLPLTETLASFLIYAHKQGAIELISKQEFELTQKLKGLS